MKDRTLLGEIASVGVDVETKNIVEVALDNKSLFVAGIIFLVFAAAFFIIKKEIG